MNLPLVFIRKKEIQLQPPEEPREYCLGGVLQGRRHFDKLQNRPPGEPREHNLGEVLQGRSKSYYPIR